MNKFKVGDKVRILDGSKISCYSGSWTKNMAEHVGEVHTILRNGHGLNSYVLDIEGNCQTCIWDERGLELVTSKFKVGDMVIGNEKADVEYHITKKGWIGKVIATRSDRKNSDIVAVGSGIDGGDVEFHLKSECFDLYAPAYNQKIVITTDGKTTTAVLYDGKKRIKEAKATCASSDKFDFNYGATLAFERLIENPKIDELKRRLNAIYGKPAIDWNKFAHGELEIKVSKDKWDQFMKQCEERNFAWFNAKATSFNPWKAYDKIGNPALRRGFDIQILWI